MVKKHYYIGTMLCGESNKEIYDITNSSGLLDYEVDNR